MAGTDTPYRSTPVLDRIAQLLKELRYGTVEITIHDGRVVQIERKEKIRLAGDGEGRRER